MNAGYLFEGILRVNPNNRKRGFVTVPELKVDVMVDGFIQQNRALEGDTVVLSLLPPNAWLKHQTGNNVVVKGAKGEAVSLNGKAAGYTNETAVETRIIDESENLAKNSDEGSRLIEEEINEIERELQAKAELASSEGESEEDKEGEGSSSSSSSSDSEASSQK